MKIDLLYFDGCPSHEAFLPRLHELLAQAQVDVPVEQRRVESDEAAQNERFLGLKCRLYPTDEGLRGAPPDEWVLSALQHAGRPAG